MIITQIGQFPLSKDCICGGIEASVYGLALELSSRHIVHCFDVPRIGGKSFTESMTSSLIVHRYTNRGNFQISMSQCVEEIVADILFVHPDVCHIHGTGLFSWLVYKALSKRGLHTIVTIHGLSYQEKRNQLKKHFSLRGLFKFVYQSITEFRMLSAVPLAIVDTDYVKEALRNYPVKLNELSTIPQGINDKYFSMQCSKDSNLIISVGAIGERKGHQLTLKAFELLRKRGVGARLTIYGVIAEQKYYEQLQKSVDSSEYHNEIELHVNAHIDELMKAYTQAHIFALHSQEESQGIVFAEAMACGLPIVATNVGGIPYVVKDKENGFLSQYGNIDTMSWNMEELLGDKSTWLRMSENAKILSKQYTWSSISEQIECLYSIRHD